MSGLDTRTPAQDYADLFSAQFAPEVLDPAAVKERGVDATLTLLMEGVCDDRRKDMERWLRPHIEVIAAGEESDDDAAHVDNVHRLAVSSIGQQNSIKCRESHGLSEGQIGVRTQVEEALATIDEKGFLAIWGLWKSGRKSLGRILAEVWEEMGGETHWVRSRHVFLYSEGSHLSGSTSLRLERDGRKAFSFYPDSDGGTMEQALEQLNRSKAGSKKPLLLLFDDFRDFRTYSGSSSKRVYDIFLGLKDMRNIVPVYIGSDERMHWANTEYVWSDTTFYESFPSKEAISPYVKEHLQDVTCIADELEGGILYARSFNREEMQTYMEQVLDGTPYRITEEGYQTVYEYTNGLQYMVQNLLSNVFLGWQFVERYPGMLKPVMDKTDIEEMYRVRHTAHSCHPISPKYAAYHYIVSVLENAVGAHMRPEEIEIMRTLIQSGEIPATDDEEKTKHLERLVTLGLLKRAEDGSYDHAAILLKWVWERQYKRQLFPPIAQSILDDLVDNDRVLYPEGSEEARVAEDMLQLDSLSVLGGLHKNEDGSYSHYYKLRGDDRKFLGRPLLRDRKKFREAWWWK